MKVSSFFASFVLAVKKLKKSFQGISAVPSPYSLPSLSLEVVDCLFNPTIGFNFVAETLRISRKGARGQEPGFLTSYPLAEAFTTVFNPSWERSNQPNQLENHLVRPAQPSKSDQTNHLVKAAQPSRQTSPPIRPAQPSIVKAAQPSSQSSPTI